MQFAVAHSVGFFLEELQALLAMAAFAGWFGSAMRPHSPRQGALLAPFREELLGSDTHGSANRGLTTYSLAVLGLWVLAG